MSDETAGCSKQVEPEHRTPDLMDNDPLLANLKALYEETKSDDEAPDVSQPSTSEPKKYSPSDGVVIHHNKNLDPGRFMWIWLLGIRVPALNIDGEPYLPIEILDEVLARQNRSDAEYFQKLLRDKNVYIKIATSTQFNAVMEKSEVCRELKISSMSMMTRSDIERIMGELRVESRPTKVEHDVWDKTTRIRVTNMNFIDYNDQWMKGEDLEENVDEYGTHGYWYPKRGNMRCIECIECTKKFTPTDFSLHHHFPVRNHGLTHVGCSSSRWSQMIRVHKDYSTEENRAAWRKFIMNSHRIGKRAYDEAEPQEPLKKKLLREDERYAECIADEEDEGEEIIKKPADVDEWAFERIEKKHLTLSDFIGHAGVDKLKPRDEFEEVIIKYLKRMDKDTLEALFLKSEDDFRIWMQEAAYLHNVVIQQKLWRDLTSSTNYKNRATANFDSSRGEFDNMQQFSDACPETKDEVRKLAEKFSLLNQEARARNLSEWDVMKKEHELLKEVSMDALRVLSNRPPPPKPKIAPPLPSLPLSLNNLNLTQFAQQLVAAGFKFPMVNALAIAPAPAPAPVLPIAPIAPIPPLSITPNLDVLKQHISLNLLNPTTQMSQSPLLSLLFPKATVSAFEQLSQFFKIASVKN